MLLCNANIWRSRLFFSESIALCEDDFADERDPAPFDCGVLDRCVMGLTPEVHALG